MPEVSKQEEWMREKLASEIADIRKFIDKYLLIFGPLTVAFSFNTLSIFQKPLQELCWFLAALFCCLIATGLALSQLFVKGSAYTRQISHINTQQDNLLEKGNFLMVTSRNFRSASVVFYLIGIVCLSFFLMKNVSAL